MIWWRAAAVAIIAALVMTAWVPRVRIADPEAPDFARYAGARSSAMVAVVAAAAAVALWRVPAAHWWLWAPYLALGAPLAYVDLRTTWLPKALHWPAAGAMALGALALVLVDWRLAAAAAFGSLAAGAFFYVAWRLSRALGFGDVRLAFLVGAVAGPAGASGWTSALLIGTVLGALHGVAHALWAGRQADRPQHFAYGPALWLGPIVATAIAG